MSDPGKNFRAIWDKRVFPIYKMGQAWNPAVRIAVGTEQVSSACRSEDEDQQAGLVSARIGGGGAVNLPVFPTRHSDAGVSSMRPPPASRSLRHQNSWGPWSGNTNINAGRWVASLQ